MNISDYFENTPGKGVLATADDKGRVDAAIYSRPRLTPANEVVFIMRDRLTRHNLQSNPYAAFLFMEENARNRGVRLFLKKLREDNDPELIAQMTRRHLTPEEDASKGQKFLVYFQVQRILPLIGDGVPDVVAV